MSGISINLSIENADRVAASLSSVKERVLPTMMKTARRAAWRTAIPGTKARISSGRGIGQRIWGVNPSGLDKVVKAGKLLLGPTWQTSVILVGIPALLENGGRIKPHFIRRGFGRPRNRIPHPGMNLLAKHHAQAALDKSWPVIMRDVNDAIGVMLKRHGF